MNTKNIILIVVSSLLVLLIGYEMTVFFGYDLYSSKTGLHVRKKAYIAIYENLPEGLLKEKADKGDPEAMAELGFRQLADAGQRDNFDDLDEVTRLAKEAADKNCATGKYLLGCVYRQQSNDQQAFSLFQESAEGNCCRAFFSLSQCYAFGIGVSKDMDKAFECIEKSALLGLPISQYCLGCVYLGEHAFGDVTVDEDISKGIDWLTLAANQGLPAAQYELSEIYFEGKITKKNLAKAKDLCRKAAEHGDREAQDAWKSRYKNLKID